jgi:hypothetical protein
MRPIPSISCRTASLVTAGNGCHYGNSGRSVSLACCIEIVHAKDMLWRFDQSPVFVAAAHAVMPCPIRREEGAMRAAYDQGKTDAEQGARQHAFQVAQQLAAAEAASRVVNAEEEGTARARLAIKTASAGGRAPFGSVPCSGEREKVVACYRFQKAEAATGGAPFWERSLQCGKLVTDLESCSHVETAALLRPSARA